MLVNLLDSVFRVMFTAEGGDDDDKGGDEEIKALPYDEFMGGQVKKRMEGRSYDVAEDASDVEKRQMAQQQRMDEMEIENNLNRQERTVRSQLPDATDGQVQMIIDKSASGDVGAMIDSIKTAIRTEEEKKGAEKGGEQLKVEGGPTTETGAGDGKKDKPVGRRESGNVITEFFKSLK